MNKVKSFELIDHGIEHSQYFQGCGTAFTDFDHVVTGIGDNPSEAIDDCLEQIASGEGDIDTEDLKRRILESESWKEFPVEPQVEDSGEDSELWYHVSIRYS